MGRVTNISMNTKIENMSSVFIKELLFDMFKMEDQDNIQ